ncbi:hypothetical protein A3D11_03355 [Candidatus Peribacteria bacterium RIFCSPHIGHO2_02_FULL_49_16]|nr:MAG: hypothetical protein A2880_04315 [Candidatus Peribacteria bacterium RIFCSPHIGHO2_01_FULL_49_38]OGJ58775.1 MAG: hypothetical protein A3D11_03355 [Candidatus Peribacteria bacterium RIFCSPHIGHO2_02_FULL_49_16]
MPRFDFHCTACNKTFEETLPFGSKDIPPCPICHKKTFVEKQMTPPLGIHFKGGGFYKTEEKREPEKGRRESEKKEEKIVKNEEKKPEKKGTDK